MAVDNIRLGGINSGFDTEAMIEQMMSSYQTKIDNQTRELTKLSWQQEAYQDITKKLTEFQSKYFDILNRDSYLMSPSTFNKFKTEITAAGGGATNGLTVTASSSANVGSHKMKVNQVATASTVKGAEIIPDNFKLDLSKAFDSVPYTDTVNDDGTTTRSYNFALDVQVAGVKKTIEFSAEAALNADGTVDMDALQSSMTESLNASLQAGFGYSGRTDGAEGATDDLGNEWFLQAELNNGEISFLVGGNASVTVSEKAGNFGLAELLSKQTVSMGSAVTGTNTVSIEIDGAVKAVSFEGVSDTYYSTRNVKGNEAILEEYNKLKEAAYRKEKNISDSTKVTAKELEEYSYSDLQAAKDKNTAALLEAANAAFKDEGVTFAIDGSTMTASTSNSKYVDFAISSVEGGTLGLTGASASNKINSKTTIEDMGIAPNADGEYSIKINGVEVTVGEGATINDLVDAVNKSDAGVIMAYSSLTNSFTLESKEMGGAGNIEIEASDMTKAFGLTDENGEEVNFTLGTNAIIELDGEELYLNSNSYNLEGVTFSFNEDIALGETFTVGVTRNHDDAKQLIKDFVNDYNTLIDEVYDYIGTKPKTDSSDNPYEPLTDAEKAEMSEEEIENWEEAAKTGILFNDNTVGRIMTKLRETMYSTVELSDGSKIGLFSIGIKTTNETGDHGKLEIDEDRLDEMFEQNPDAIVSLFTDSENGVMKKLDTVIDSAIRSTGSEKTRGSLIRKAGLESGATSIDNTIYRQMERLRDRISELQDRYERREEYWWSVFTNMEKMMGDLNDQSNYISSYLGQQ